MRPIPICRPHLNRIVPIIERRKLNLFFTSMAEKDPLFVCTISATKTAGIPGITVAGANPELVKATPAADAELLFYGRCRSIRGVPATPDGKPTPALITMTALRLANIPIFVVDAGTEVKPQAPYICLGAPGPGEDIRTGRAVERAVVERVFEYGKILGQNFANLGSYIVLGESIPAGTTTALGVLMALGIDARDKMSSSMPNNPRKLKARIVEQGMEAANVSLGSLKHDPLGAVSALGDTMIPAVAGMAVGGASRTWVVLAGGTQMAAVLAVIKGVDPQALDRVVLATTTYIINDPTSDIKWVIERIARVPLVGCDPGLSKTSKPGLRAYSSGFVKEGVGAGGAVLAAMLKSKGEITTDILRAEIERNYERIIEPMLIPT